MNNFVLKLKKNKLIVVVHAFNPKLRMFKWVDLLEFKANMVYKGVRGQTGYQVRPCLKR